jgi:hypothetical protein
MDRTLHAALVGGCFCGVLTMLGLSSRSATRSDRALGVIAAGQRLITAHPVRQRVGMILASGAFDMECNDVAAKGWFVTCVAGGNSQGRGKAVVEAWRAPGGGVLDWVGFGKDRPWTVSSLDLVVDVADVDAVLGRKRGAAVKAGYMAAGGEESVRATLLALGGKDTVGEEGLITLEVCRVPAAGSQEEGKAAPPLQ